MRAVVAKSILAKWTAVAFGGLLLLAFSSVPEAVAGDALKSQWVAQWHALHAREKAISAELREARIEYGRGRRANRRRGAERAEVLARIDRLERQLAIVESDLATFDERARRAGALPGWFRENGPDADSPASGRPAP